MKINGKKLKAAAEKAGLSTTELGAAIAMPGFGPDAAESALRNWMADRNHPRAKPEHMRRIAQALSVRPAEFARFVSVASFVRGSERKGRLVADMIRGMPVDRAMTALNFSDKRAAVSIRKSLSAAIADAEQADADVGSLIVAESRVDGGPIIKRFQPKDRGRAHPIKKRLSHIVVGVEEKN